MARFYAWDAVEMKIRRFDVEIPDGCTPRQALALADDAMSAKDMESLSRRKVRQVGDVFVMDGVFGRDQEAHIYWCPEGDASQARKLAKQELEKDTE